MQACKPGSVSRVSAWPLSFILPWRYHQDQSVYPSHQSDRSGRSSFCKQKEQYDLFDLSTRKVYHAPFIAVGTVGSYSTFSLSPHSRLAGLGLPIFCGTVCQSRVVAGKPALSYGTMPDVARTFLIPLTRDAIRRLARCKNSEIGGKFVFWVSVCLCR